MMPPKIKEEITKLSVKYTDKITTHLNEIASTLIEGEESRILKIFKPTDLTSRFPYITFHSWYRDWLRAGRSGKRIPVGARFSAPVQTGPGAHPASCIMRTGAFPGVESGRGMTMSPHPF
jgi:hypothetical protein